MSSGMGGMPWAWRRMLKQPDISLDAVKRHTRAAFTTLGAANRAEAVTMAMRGHSLKM